MHQKQLKLLEHNYYFCGLQGLNGIGRRMAMEPFEIRGFNLCESILRHTPEQLRTFIRRMKSLNLNTLIVHYDYGFRRYQDIILEECENANVEIILMTFGPRTFLSYSQWKTQWFAKKIDGTPYTERLECDTYPCAYEPEVLQAYEYGARQWLLSLPKQIRHVHMRAADGLLFCQCEKCRVLPDHEKWQPFVDIFVKAVQECRPDLKFETDVYVKRYNIPKKQEAFHAMDNIMYDTFYRHTFYPIGSDKDIINKELVSYATTEEIPDAKTPNAYHGNRLKEWTTSFPGKVYIHENAMAQSLFGNFQHSTGTYLEDLKLYRKLGVKGVCYEAYEPGYAGFSEMFEILAKAMNGEDVNYMPSQVEQDMKKMPMHLFCDNPDFKIEKYIKNPIYLKHAELYRKYMLQPTADLYREYVEFAFAHEDILDPIYIGFCMAQSGLILKHLQFANLSPEADEMLHRRKLWDFMEEIPLGEDPRAVCRKLIYELAEKAQNHNC